MSLFGAVMKRMALAPTLIIVTILTSAKTFAYRVSANYELREL
jgi:hypothetical protein